MTSEGHSGCINIVVVDDQRILRECLAAMLDRQPMMKVVGTAGTGVDAVNATVRLHPHVVTMELMLPALSGLDATMKIREVAPCTRVVILSAFYTSEHVFRALRAGAHGYALKKGAATELMDAICTVHAGKRFLSPLIDSVRLDALLTKPQPTSPLESLSSRERQVMHLTVAGLSSAKMGRILCLSKKTVDTYRCRLMAKLGVSSLMALAHFAITNGSDIS